MAGEQTAWHQVLQGPEPQTHIVQEEVWKEAENQDFSAHTQPQPKAR